MFKKGVSGNLAGRPKSLPATIKEQIKKCFEDHDFNPIVNLIVLAQTTDDEDMRFSCNKELAQYFAPKLRAIEIKGDAESPLNFVLNIQKHEQ